MGNIAVRYTYAGTDQVFTVPDFVGTLNFKVWGAGGGAGQQSGTTSQDVAGGGGSSYIGATIINGSTLNTAQNGTFGSVNATLLSPPQTTDSDYISGVGVGSSSAAGGNGPVVISYIQPDLILNKIVDKSYADVGETLTYTKKVIGCYNYIRLCNI